MLMLNLISVIGAPLSGCRLSIQSTARGRLSRRTLLLHLLSVLVALVVFTAGSDGRVFVRRRSRERRQRRRFQTRRRILSDAAQLLGSRDRERSRSRRSREFEMLRTERSIFWIKSVDLIGGGDVARVGGRQTAGVQWLRPGAARASSVEVRTLQSFALFAQSRVLAIVRSEHGGGVRGQTPERVTGPGARARQMTATPASSSAESGRGASSANAILSADLISVNIQRTKLQILSHCRFVRTSNI